MDEERKMPVILSKLFSRGNRSSDRFYADRARPTLASKQLARERRDDTPTQAANETTKK
jgi:hypothetical protein